jgi:hypothetical protein
VVKTRKRAMPFMGPGGRWYGYQKVASNPATPINGRSAGGWNPKHLQGTQVTVSESHPEWHKHRRNPGKFQGDVGGAFDSQKRYTTAKAISGTVNTHALGIGGFLERKITYSGLVVPTAINYQFPPFAGGSDSDLAVAGTKAINGCKPTNIFVDLASSLAEFLREGVPKLGTQVWESATDALRDAARGHLTVQFGFQPIVSDVYTTLDALIRSDAAIQQYVRDSGKMVRRGYDFPEQANESHTLLESGVPPYRHYSDAEQDAFFGPGKVYRTRKSVVRRWFRGAFTYHLPLDDSLEEMSAAALRARGLISLELTPETLWNIMPWSWAVDWIVPVGDYVSYLQDMQSDGLVLRYGYLMEHSVHSDTYTWVGKQSVGTLTLTSERKRRIRATPFGFGTRWSDLSPRQLSIAAALGISESGRR